MPNTSNILYESPASIGITLASLASNTYAVSSPVDNSVIKAISADIQIKLRTGISVDVLPSMPTVALFIIKSIDGGITYDDVGWNSQLLNVFSAEASDTDYVFSVDTSQSTVLPDFWKLAVYNKTGDDFNATPANFGVNYIGKKYINVLS